tara:strand:+ start:217 stop:408 length:192 start_codon:yes stop_codon:yes gene_type:complete
MISLYFVSNCGIVMVTVDRSLPTRRIRRELILSGADPYLVAAAALDACDRLQAELKEYRKLYS